MPFDGSNHLTLSVIYTEDDFLELRATVNSKSDRCGNWAGNDSAYINEESLFEFAEQLAAFSKRVGDPCEFTAGDLDCASSSYPGSIRLRFYAKDKSKHIACYCQLVEWAMEAAERNCLQVVLSIEAASLDEFIKQLRDLAQGSVDSASLLFE